MLMWIREAFPVKATLIFLSIVSGFYFFGDLLWDFGKKEVPAVVEEVKEQIRPLQASDEKLFYVMPSKPNLNNGLEIQEDTNRVLRI